MSGAIDTPETVNLMFDSIAPRYDLMNRLMTGWQDERWRHVAARVAVGDVASCALDVATGTGGLARALHDAGIPAVTAVDVSSGMLDLAAVRLSRYDGIHLQWADVMELPFVDEVFDACTVGFGLRNMPDYHRAIDEMTRVLRPGGRLVILELTPLETSDFGRIFDVYFGRIVPILGWVVTGDRDAYRYLPESVKAFPDARSLASMLHRSGLIDIRWRTFAGGTVALHTGRKQGGGENE